MVCFNQGPDNRSPVHRRPVVSGGQVAPWGCLARKAENASFAGTYQERSCKNSTTRVVRVTCSAALPAEQLQSDGRLALISRGFRGWRLVTDAGCWLSGASCGDRFRWCALVPRPGVCGHHFYGRQCCKTCAASNL